MAYTQTQNHHTGYGGEEAIPGGNSALSGRGADDGAADDGDEYGSWSMDEVTTEDNHR